MSLHSPRKTPEQIGVELASRLKHFVATLPTMLSSLQIGQFLAIDDVDRKQLIWEATILMFVGQRLAVQLISKKGAEQDMELRKRICNALDSSALAFLDTSNDFQDLLNRRGEQYFQLLKAEGPNSEQGDWAKFHKALQFKFEQFCRGGDRQRDAILVIGSIRSVVPLNILATKSWLAGFMKTAEYITHHIE